jgi:hypothetical protein
LRDFLDVGADDILLNIGKMEEYRRALDVSNPDLKKIWDTIQKVFPNLSTLASAVAKISPLF